MEFRHLGKWFYSGLGGFILGCSLFFVVLNLAGEVYDYQDTFDGVHLPEVDAIVCLAGGKGRIAAAGDLWSRYYEQRSQKKVPILYFSGLGPQAGWNVIARQVRRGVAQELRRQDVIFENESSNTLANATWFADFLASKPSWRRILLLTSSYHMKRAKFMFENVLKTRHQSLQIETYSVFQEPFSADEWKSGPNGIRVTFLEYFKFLYYRSL